ncbi:MAG: stage II sporulation protein M [Parachlamydiaceae bacterium]|nr:stage II sporulation protein M [Parachlamydiaceae bacterium]
MDKITIKSYEQVDLEFTLAGIGRRGLAGLIDSVIQSIFIFILAVLVILYCPVSTNLLKIVAVFICMFGYRFPFEHFCRGQTPGKMIIGIRVIGADGRRPNWRQTLLRTLIGGVDSLGLYALAGIVIFCTPKSQRFGDLAAGTYVIVCNSCTLPTTGMLWLSNLETKGRGQDLRLQKGPITPETLLLIEKFLQRRTGLSEDRRKYISYSLSRRVAGAAGWDLEAITPESSEGLLVGVFTQLTGADSFLEAKKSSWKEIENRFKSARKSLKKLSSAVIQDLIRDYRYILTTVGQARILGGDSQTCSYLNHLVILGHQAFYPSEKNQGKSNGDLFWGFSRVVGRHRGAVALSAMFFFSSSLIAYFAVQNSPQVGFDLVADLFYDFKPESDLHLHEISSLTRPMAAGTIIANNIQVSISGFALGITGGIGTLCVIIYNGLHIGAVIGWMNLQGDGYALWGWIMPHGVTEILAIILACGGGFVIADALWMPKYNSRLESLKVAAIDALMIEVGVMGMLGIAGLIEGFVSPSSLEYPGRIAIVVASTLIWFLYFVGGFWREIKVVDIGRQEFLSAI